MKTQAKARSVVKRILGANYLPGKIFTVLGAGKYLIAAPNPPAL